MSSSKPGDSSNPSRSGSAIVAHTARGYHILKIDGYSFTKSMVPTGECLGSTPFTVGGHRWCLWYYPNGFKSETADHVAIFLELLDDTTVAAQYQFRFADEVLEDPVELELDEHNIFERETEWMWGDTKFVKREVLEKSEHLRDNSFAVRCDIRVFSEFRAEEAPLTFVEVPSPDMGRHFADLLRTGTGADVMFHVGGVTVPAHRWTLGARSPVFTAEFFGVMKESGGTGVAVHVHDMDAQVFKALLYFMYTDSFP